MFDTIKGIFYQPILISLTYLYGLLGNLGLAIIALTLIIRIILLPITLPGLRSTARMRDLQPELNAIKKKYKDDRVKQQQAQMELFKEHNINPASGCLPYIFQFIILIALYRVFINFLQPGSTDGIDTTFLWLDLAQPAPYYIFPILAGLTQLVLGLMLMPATDTSAEKTLAASTKDKQDDQQAEDMTAMAASMQKQMVYVMPVLTAFLALRFPSGLTLYWVISTLFSIAQQYYVSGWGGLKPALIKVSGGRFGAAS